MKHLELTPRLQLLADWVRPGAKLADVGTDHAYLPVWLLLHHRVEHAIASDLRQGPLERARQTGRAWQVHDLDLRLGDGLSGISPDEADTVVIAGMGGEHIAAILAAAPWTRDGCHTMLLQPMTRAQELCAMLSREEERPAEFNEVNLKVQEDYIAATTTRLAREAAERAVKELAALPADKRLASKLWTGTQEFTLVNPPLTRMGGQIVEAALGLGPGDLSPVLPTPDGAMIVSVAKRTAPDMAELAKSKDQWDMIWRQQKTGAQQADFQEFLNSQCIFELAETAK